MLGNISHTEKTNSHDSCRALVASAKPLRISLRCVNNMENLFYLSNSVSGYTAEVLQTALNILMFTNPRESE